MRVNKVVCFLLVGVLTELVNGDFDAKELKSTKSPDIILIVADDLGFNDVPWHNKEVIAPTLQKLSSEGVILENSYVQPICSPTRSALLSGRYPFTIGRQNGVIWPLMPTGLTLDVPIIPQLLKPLGYDTHAIGKWHLGFCNWSYTPTERGFDTFNGFLTGSEDYYSHIRNYQYFNDELRYKEQQGLFLHSESFSNDNVTTFQVDQVEYKGKWKKYSGYDFRNNRKPDFQARGTYSSFAFASHAEQILKKADPGTPKFIYLPFQNVHSPLQVPDNYTRPFRHIRNKNRRTYLGMVLAMDEAIGRVVKALNESGRYNNSVIIFTTDNGGPTISGANNWPLRGNKTTLWEGGTRGAAFIHSPLLKNSGPVSYNLIHTTDWLSTIVTIAGGTPPNDTDGVDQWKTLNNLEEEPRKEMIYNINYNKNIGFQAGIRVKQYKLLIGDPGKGEWIPPPTLKNTFSVQEISSKHNFLNRSSNDHMAFIRSLKTECESLACFQNVLQYYQNSRSLNIGPKMKTKIIVLIKRYKKALRKWLKRSERERKNALDSGTQLMYDNQTLFLGLEHRTLLGDIFGDELPPKLPIRLYNLKYDPSEKNNISKENPKIVEFLLERLMSYRDRWVDPDTPKDDPKGDPSYWGGVWSPGWC